jgi:hypothetical protein
MNPTPLLRDAYIELDETGSLSARTRASLLHAGIDPDTVEITNEASKEIEETE